MKVISKSDAISLGLKKFFTGIPCINGHISERYVGCGKCIECIRLRSKSYYKRNAHEVKKRSNDYYKQNSKTISEKRKTAEFKESKNAKRREYYKANKDKFAELRKKNKESISKSNKKQYQKNIELNRARARDYYRENRGKCMDASRRYQKNNPVQLFMRRCVERVLSDWKGGREDAEKANGYSNEQLVAHIESLFVDGMSWENRSDWHIDHIKPISAFIREGVRDPKIINALENLRPLWAKDNLSKGSSWEG